MTAEPPPPAGAIRMATVTGRWIVAATVLGSGVAFLDSTVVNVALPSIRHDLGGGLAGIQWIVDGYLVTLSALLLLGGSLGDRYGRRRSFVIGLAGFAVASMLSGLAPNIQALIAFRALQGAAAALLVPESMAIISASFHPDDRGRAVGAWAGLSGMAGAVGPFLGGWLVDAASWRWVFFVNLPVVAITIAIAVRHVPETRDPDAPTSLDAPGAVTASLGLAGLAYALIEGAGHLGPGPVAAGVIGGSMIVAFVVIEHRSKQPMVPLSIFRSRQFTGANLATLAVYIGFGGTTFLVVLELQLALHYSALSAGAALMPITGLLLVLSARAGALSQRIGPRLPMTIGPMVMAAGLVLLAEVGPGSHYLTGLLPALVLCGCGLSLTVAPLTSAVLAAVDEHHLGVGSGINNAFARVAGLLAVALLPALVHLDLSTGTSLDRGYGDALHLAAGFCALGGLIAFATIRTQVAVPPVTQPALTQPCHSPDLVEATVTAAGQ